MTIFNNALIYDLLDLLVDGQSSFAALYGSLVRHCGYPSNMSVDLCLDALFDMEEKGWITARQMQGDGSFRPPTEKERSRDRKAYCDWLPGSAYSDLSIDEVGLWFGIESKGREAWKIWSHKTGVDERKMWAIDENPEEQSLIVSAENIQLARDALRNWLAFDSTIKLIKESESVKSLPLLKLRNGTNISNGVQLTYLYHRTN
jgi:hypothetical protein